MNIFISSLSSFLDDRCHEWFEEHNKKVSLLGSLANDKNSINQILSGEVKCCSNFMWDSGAVSASNGKVVITLEDYVGWVKQIPKSEVPITIVGLDVIGDPIASQKNYLKLKYDYGFGNDFLPAFHYGEDFSYLDFLIKEGFTYIGLGGVGAGSRLGQDALRDWLKQVFFINGDGRTLRYPGIKFHGFAITSEKTLPLFPFHSADSATWVKNSAIGKILTPFGDFRVSDDPRAGKDVQHFKRLSPKTRDKINDWVRSFDIVPEELITDRWARHIINVNYFKWMEENHNWQPAPMEHFNLMSALKDSGVDPEQIKQTDKKKIKFGEAKLKEKVLTLSTKLFTLKLKSNENSIDNVTTTNGVESKVVTSINEPSEKIEQAQVVGVTSMFGMSCPHCGEGFVVKVSTMRHEEAGIEVNKLLDEKLEKANTENLYKLSDIIIQ